MERIEVLNQLAREVFPRHEQVHVAMIDDKGRFAGIGVVALTERFVDGRWVKVSDYVIKIELDEENIAFEALEVSLKRILLRRAFAALESAEHVGSARDSDEEFRKMISLVVEWFGVPNVADLLRTSRPTVERWSTGVSSPHPGARESIRNTLKNLLDRVG